MCYHISRSANMDSMTIQIQVYNKTTYILQPAQLTGCSKTLIDNKFMKFVSLPIWLRKKILL